MSYRFMRVMVFFDLPVETAENRREYRRFRKLLIKNGFFMMQKSVYCRMVLNPSIENSIKTILRKNQPTDGCVQVLTITEKQFTKIEYITGENTSDVIDSDDRMVIL